ncbi:flavin reductase family protein [Rhodococcus jostii]|uniref:Flavin reductase family protein n=1 Tax=Rhodococcus jostii TaxID=132919 RepID=A0ABU4CLS9_RHOJO|nr:flavin reductase family protein [Rhodococcus jostii]MDV6284521.1 flavin reductase family protein [Rhodococcus jostii]
MVRIQQMSGTSQLRKAFGAFPSGVAALCARIDQVPVGMAASSFTSVSVDPPLVSVCIQKTSTTWPLLRGRHRLGLSVLSQWHDVACRQLASKEGDRFAGVEWDASAHDSIFIRRSSAWMEVSLYDEVEAGDHTIALLEVHGIDTAPDTPPLIFHASKFRQIALTRDEELRLHAHQW